MITCTPLMARSRPAPATTDSESGLQARAYKLCPICISVDLRLLLFDHIWEGRSRRRAQAPSTQGLGGNGTTVLAAPRAALGDDRRGLSWAPRDRPKCLRGRPEGSFPGPRERASSGCDTPNHAARSVGGQRHRTQSSKTPALPRITHVPLPQVAWGSTPQLSPGDTGITQPYRTVMRARARLSPEDSRKLPLIIAAPWHVIGQEISGNFLARRCVGTLDRLRPDPGVRSPRADPRQPRHPGRERPRQCNTSRFRRRTAPANGCQASMLRVRSFIAPYNLPRRGAFRALARQGSARRQANAIPGARNPRHPEQEPVAPRPSPLPPPPHEIPPLLLRLPRRRPGRSRRDSTGRTRRRPCGRTPAPAASAGGKRAANQRARGTVRVFPRTGPRSSRDGAARRVVPRREAFRCDPSGPRREPKAASRRARRGPGRERDPSSGGSPEQQLARGIPRASRGPDGPPVRALAAARTRQRPPILARQTGESTPARTREAISKGGCATLATRDWSVAARGIRSWPGREGDVPGRWSRRGALPRVYCPGFYA